MRSVEGRPMTERKEGTAIIGGVPFRIGVTFGAPGVPLGGVASVEPQPAPETAERIDFNDAPPPPVVLPETFEPREPDRHGRKVVPADRAELWLGGQRVGLVSDVSLPEEGIPLEPMIGRRLPLNHAAPSSFVLYGFDACPHCAELKAHLGELGIPFEWVPEEDGERRQRLYDAWGLVGPERTMPQLFADGERLGGKDAVKAIDPRALRALAR